MYLDNLLDWIDTVKEATGIYLYSFRYAADSLSSASGENHSKVESFRLGIALRKGSKDHIPYLDLTAQLQLIPASLSDGSLRPDFYGRALSPIRADIQLARAWLNECERHHGSLCETGLKDGSETAYVRTAPRDLRVIDVNSMNLVSLPENAKYVALSYCWGQSKTPFKTTTSNLANLQESGALRTLFSSIPRVIQDAMDLVREIGQSYLWIDALCIVQDSQEDKNLQISQMDRVYDGASLTIISAPRTLGASAACEGLPGYRDNSRVLRQSTAAIQGLQLCTTFHGVEQATLWSAWSTRAWTYQEQILSRRRLYFTETQMYFHCLSDVFCEDVHSERKSSSAYIYPGTSAWNPGASFTLGLSRSKLTPLSRSLRYYHEMVEDYTVRDMTDQADALAALEGIFSILRSTMDTESFTDFPRSSSTGLCFGRSGDRIDDDKYWLKEGLSHGFHHGRGLGGRAIAIIARSSWVKYEEKRNGIS